MGCGEGAAGPLPAPLRVYKPLGEMGKRNPHTCFQVRDGRIIPRVIKSLLVEEKKLETRGTGHH